MDNELYTARQAAQLLGYRAPSTAQKKAGKAYREHNQHVQKIGHSYAAPLWWWKALLAKRGFWRGESRK